MTPKLAPKPEIKVESKANGGPKAEEDETTVDELPELIDDTPVPSQAGKPK